MLICIIRGFNKCTFDNVANASNRMTRTGSFLCRDDEVLDKDRDRAGAWRVQPKEGGWRTREKAKEDSWRSGPR